MLHEDPGNVSYSAVGGLSDQIRDLRESIELPLMNPELFIRVGIKPPKVTKFFASFLFHFLFSFFVDGQHFQAHHSTAE
jgi:SpoVK/Ycf46/Vps4 family AAA+-type ATPase